MEHDFRVDGDKETAVCRRCGMVWVLDFMGYIDAAAAEADRNCTDPERQPVNAPYQQ